MCLSLYEVLCYSFTFKNEKIQRELSTKTDNLPTLPRFFQWLHRRGGVPPQIVICHWGGSGVNHSFSVGVDPHQLYAITAASRRTQINRKIKQHSQLKRLFRNHTSGVPYIRIKNWWNHYLILLYGLYKYI